MAGLKLEIGPGEHPLEGEWTRFGSGWGECPFVFKDGVVEEVYASHVIEHVPWYRVQFAIAEVFRVLKSGGLFEVHTVDFAKIVTAYRLGAAPDEWDAGMNNVPCHWMRWISGRLFCYEKNGDASYWHKSLFDEPYLRELFDEAGFVDIERVEEPRGREKHRNINLGLRGTKP